MSIFSLHIDVGRGTMACDYDHDIFDQGLKFQHSCESGHGQWSWSKSPEIPCPASKIMQFNFEQLID